MLQTSCVCGVWQVKAFAESALSGSMKKQQAKLEEAESLVKASGPADKEVRAHAGGVWRQGVAVQGQPQRGVGMQWGWLGREGR
jgi:hypothetical protein